MKFEYSVRDADTCRLRWAGVPGDYPDPMIESHRVVYDRPDGRGW